MVREESVRGRINDAVAGDQDAQSQVRRIASDPDHPHQADAEQAVQAFDKY